MQTLSATPTGDRFRQAFGPLLVGLIGGALIGLAALTDPTWYSADQTLASFPKPSRAPVNQYEWYLTTVGYLLRYGIPLVIGLATVWVARTTDRWSDASAGLMAGLAASFVACVGVIGWQTTVAHTVVPSIADMTNLGKAVSRPESEEVRWALPVTNLADSYPGMENVAAEQRASVLVAKVTAEQLHGIQRGLLSGGLLSLMSVGVATLAGALAGGHLRRHPMSNVRATGRYVEMVFPITLTLTNFGWFGSVEFSPVEWTYFLVASAASIAWFALALSGAPRMQRTCMALFWMLLIMMRNRLDVPGMLTIGFFMGIAMAAMRFRNEPETPAEQEWVEAVNG